MPIVSPAEVSEMLTLGDDDLGGRLTALTDAACELVELYLNRKLPKAQHTEIHSGGGEALTLKAYPVESVAEVTLNGAPIDHHGLIPESGLLYRRTGWPRHPGGYVVKYTGGLDAIPASIKQAVALLVESMADAVDNKGQQIASERLADYQVSYFRAAEAIGLAALSGAAAALLAPHRNKGY